METRLNEHKQPPARITVSAHSHVRGRTSLNKGQHMGEGKLSLSKEEIQQFQMQRGSNHLINDFIGDLSMGQQKLPDVGHGRSRKAQQPIIDQRLVHQSQSVNDSIHGNQSKIDYVNREQ